MENETSAATIVENAKAAAREAIAAAERALKAKSKIAKALAAAKAARKAVEASKAADSLIPNRKPDDISDATDAAMKVEQAAQDALVRAQFAKSSQDLITAPAAGVDSAKLRGLAAASEKAGKTAADKTAAAVAEHGKLAEAAGESKEGCAKYVKAARDASTRAAAQKAAAIAVQAAAKALEFAWSSP
jgi:hypothetical protein